MSAQTLPARPRRRGAGSTPTPETLWPSRSRPPAPVSSPLSQELGFPAPYERRETTSSAAASSLR